MDTEIVYECACGIRIGDMLESGRGISTMADLEEHAAYDHISREIIYKKVTRITIHFDTKFLK